MLTPVLVPLQLLERRGLNLMGFSHPNEPGAAEEELRLLVESVEDNSALEEDEREMIHGIFEMSERPAREVMRPRIDIVSESRDATVGQVLDRIVESGFSRIPIYENSIDEVVGIVYAKDILRHLREGTLDDPAAPIARAAHFIPETKKVDELLQEIVGEIQDEYDLHEEQLLEQVSEREAVVDARTPLRDLNDVFDLHLNVEDFDTLGGLVYHELGKVPVEGDEVRVNGCQVTVLSTQGRRIKKLRVTLVGEPLA
jgi:CBS domain containing-hemolysin-like protein